MTDTQQHIKTYGGAALGAFSPVLAELNAWLGLIAAVLGIVWVSMQIIEKLVRWWRS